MLGQCLSFRASHKFLENSKLTLSSILTFSSRSLYSSFPEDYTIEFDDPFSHLTDLTKPSSWYPAARTLNRKIIAHLGPTNSGKTHNALESLSYAPSGVYCGPLRLLAWEVANKLNNRHPVPVACSMVTGQEIKTIDGAKHIACTVEMASTKRRVDVAVIDEIQLLADKTRGWAFTRALIGLPASEVHVCGDPAVLPLLEKICEENGEALIVKRYDRLTPLTVSPRTLARLDRARPGDCIIAFSRREVHSLRYRVEKESGRKCAVVYGSLPPAARSQQAQLFNAPRSGVNVMAASDAVGMGLNLAIKRIVFTTLEKYNGQEVKPLSVAEIKQIAGRAGRFGSKYPNGTCTTVYEEDLDALREALESPSEPLQAAALFPRFEDLAAFTATYQYRSYSPSSLDLSFILEDFAAQASVGNHYFFCQFEDMKTNAYMIRHLPLSLFEQYTFAIAPADPNDEALSSCLLTLATVFSQRTVPLTPQLLAHPPIRQALSSEELAQLESIHRLYDLYIWLSYRFDEFQDREDAELMREHVSAVIDRSIKEMGVAKVTKMRSTIEQISPKKLAS